MLIEPPIEELLKQSDNNRYELCVLAGKRAKEIANKHFFDPAENKPVIKEITLALEEIDDGKVTADNL